MPASVNFETSSFQAGIIDPGYNAARDRFRLQQTHLTVVAAEWDELSG
jgi:hypothetical protein